jgi:hypothetical protein
MFCPGRPSFCSSKRRTSPETEHSRRSRRALTGTRGARFSTFHAIHARRRRNADQRWCVRFHRAVGRASIWTKLLRPMLLSCFDIASCKPRSAEHQRHCLSTPFRLYGGAPRVAPEILLVCGNLGLIEEAADNGKVRELAAAAQRAADLGAKLTAQLLAFSRRRAYPPSGRRSMRGQAADRWAAVAVPRRSDPVDGRGY